MNKQAFTLIELLVVVLIIGILAAIAVPQYQTAVTKARYSNMITLAESFKSAQERYYMENNQYASSIFDLDIDIGGEKLPAGVNGQDAYKVKNFYIFTSATQLACYWKNDENKLMMMYNLWLDNATRGNPDSWHGGRAQCRAYYRSGPGGRAVCKSLPGAHDCEDRASSEYIQCFMN